jgi:hypothetical protein
MRRSLLAAAAATLVAAARDAATFRVKTAPLQAQPVSRRMVGFSIEVGSTPEMLCVGGLGGPARVSYANLMNQLRVAANSDRGPNVRVGGNSADESVWIAPTTPLPVNDTYRIGPQDLACYAASVPGWNGSRVLDVNLRDAASPALAVAHLTAAQSLGWELIESVAIGNEVRAKAGARAGGGAAAFSIDWGTTHTAHD